MASDSSKAELSEAIDSMIEEVRLRGKIQIIFMFLSSSGPNVVMETKDLRKATCVLAWGSTE